jgi:hypothetical protein
MDGFSLPYHSFGRDESVEIDFRTRTIRGPGAALLLYLIERWEEDVAKDPMAHWVGNPVRDPIYITHPWSSVRDMVAFMVTGSWNDLRQWPKELLELLPPESDPEPPGPGVILHVN